MDENDSLYKREEDRKWREKVDNLLLTLVTSDQVQNDRLKRLEKTSVKHDRALLGDAEKDTDGMVARQHGMETEIRKFNAILFRDSTGKGGLVDQVKDLETGERTSEFRWKTLIAILGWISAVTVAVIYNADRIAILAKHLLHKQIAHSTPVLRRSGTKKRRAVVVPPEADDVTEEDLRQ